MWMMDKHVSKILLEAIQMLCTAIRLIDPSGNHEGLYRPTHANHPVSIWVRESRENFEWTLDLVEALHAEWKFRYQHPEEKHHKSYLLVPRLRAEISKFPVKGVRSPFALAMPDECKIMDDPLASYRIYYQTPEKQRIASWKRRNPPVWYTVT